MASVATAGHYSVYEALLQNCAEGPEFADGFHKITCFLTQYLVSFDMYFKYKPIEFIIENFE